MDRSPGFGSNTPDYFALLRLAFASAPTITVLTLPDILSRRSVLQKVRCQTLYIRRYTIVLQQFVSIRFQVLFHSPPGVLFTFPSRYWFTIGRQGVFSLGRWSSQIPTGFHVSRGTRGHRREPQPFRLQDFHLLRSIFPDRSAKAEVGNSLTGPYTCLTGPTTPDEQRAWAYTHPV